MITKFSVGTKNASTREQWVKNELAKIKRGKKILDAGAGEQIYKPFCHHLHYFSQDFNQYDGKGDRREKQTGSWDNSKTDIISDITSIPKPNGYFDVILCTEVLEHVPNPLAGFSEFHRLLKKGGKLILTAPFCSLTHFSPYHFYTGFTKYFYEKELTAAGFQIDKIYPNGNYFEYLAQEIWRLPAVTKQYARSKFNKIDSLILYLILRKLQGLSTKGEKSSELLCFGYQLVATKSK